MKMVMMMMIMMTSLVHGIVVQEVMGLIVMTSVTSGEFFHKVVLHTSMHVLCEAM